MNNPAERPTAKSLYRQIVAAHDQWRTLGEDLQKEYRGDFHEYLAPWLAAVIAAERPPEPEPTEGRLARLEYMKRMGHGDERQCGHPDLVANSDCVECAYDLGKRSGHAEAGAYYTWDEVKKKLDAEFGVAERRDPLEPSPEAIKAAKSSLERCIGEDANDDVAMMLRAAYAIDRRGTGAEPTAGEEAARRRLWEAIQVLRGRGVVGRAEIDLVDQRINEFAGALRAGGPPEEEVELRDRIIEHMTWCRHCGEDNPAECCTGGEDYRAWKASSCGGSPPAP